MLLLWLATLVVTTRQNVFASLLRKQFTQNQFQLMILQVDCPCKKLLRIINKLNKPCLKVLSNSYLLGTFY